MSRALLYAAVFSLLTAFSSAQSFKYAAINYPQAKSTIATGINGSNVIVGSFVSSTGHTHGFRYQSGKFYYINVPNSTRTYVGGINDAGDIVGTYSLPGTSSQPANSHGFLLHNGVFKTIDCPGAPFSAANGINKYGRIVGSCETSQGDVGFIYSNGSFSYVNAPTTTGSPATQLNGISNVNTIAGQVFSGDRNRGFVKAGSDLDFIKPLFAMDNVAQGINSRGDIVGCDYGSRAFIAYTVESGETSESNEAYPVLHNFSPLGHSTSCGMGINYGRLVVGWYYDSNNVQHGFLAVPQ